ncbi:phosphoserine phosphatase [Lachnospiraceae bacterium JC7]|nr:phosphoserine phosphatase [Lachnospiraceae bacterium JC7]
MELGKKQVSVVWSYIAVVLIAVTIALCVAIYTVINTKINLAKEEAAAAVTEAVTEAAVETTGADADETESLPEAGKTDISGIRMLDLWENSATLKQQLISYVERITDESNNSFIPVDRRIAVFDLDGTLFCETDPTYFVDTLLVHRVMEDEGYKDRASKFEKQTVEKFLERIEAGKTYDDLQDDIGKCISSAFSDITLDELDQYVQAYKTLPMPDYEGLLRGDAWYLPMLQVVSYLKANDFTVYIITGSDRFIARGLIHNSPLDIPDAHIIGSDRTVLASGQGDNDPMVYAFSSGDRIITGGERINTAIQMNKVGAIVREIGLQPVLSFGNSSGDASMLEYVITGNQYESMSFALCCDDLERENGNLEKAEKMREMCRENKWIPVSMKDDWTTIYGDGVMKKITVVDAAG